MNEKKEQNEELKIVGPEKWDEVQKKKWVQG